MADRTRLWGCYNTHYQKMNRYSCGPYRVKIRRVAASAQLQLLYSPQINAHYNVALAKCKISALCGTQYVQNTHVDVKRRGNACIVGASW